MAIGSGLSAQLGMKKEVTYGTRVVPDKFYEFETEGGVSQQKYLESRGKRAGRFFQSGPRRVLTTSDALIPVTFEVPNKGMGAWFDLMHGNTVTPVVQGATTAYLQTHNLTGDPSKSCTIQTGKPSADGTVRPFDYLGCMLTDVSFSCAVDGWLTGSMTLDSQDEDTAQSLAVASYPTALTGFNFQECVVTVNGVVQNLATTGALVKGMALNLGLPRAVDRYGLRSTPFKAKPILNDYTPGSGSLDFEFDDMVQYGLYQVGTKVPIIIDFTSSSATLAGTALPFRITFTIASAQFTGTTPVVDSFDILSFSAPFEILDDGTNPPVVITVMSTDSAVL